MARVFLKNYHGTPRKVRAVADIIRGKSAAEALTLLTFLPKRSASPLAKLLKSALANAGSGATSQKLMVTDIRVEKGIVMRRMMPRARGSAAPIKKRLSHITITVLPKTSSASTAATSRKAKHLTPNT